MILEISSGLLLALAFFGLSTGAAYVVKRYDLEITKALWFFVGLTIFKLGALLLFSYFLSKKSGNIFIFLVVFATAFSLLLVPEVIMMLRAFKR